MEAVNFHLGKHASPGAQAGLRAFCKWASAVSWLPGRQWETRGCHAVPEPHSLILGPCPSSHPAVWLRLLGHSSGCSEKNG